jgi:hypothetical protein
VELRARGAGAPAGKPGAGPPAVPSSRSRRPPVPPPSRECQRLTPPAPPFPPTPPPPAAAKAIIKGEFATGNFKVDKLQIGSDKKLVGEFSLKDAAPSTKLTFKATDGTRAAGADVVSAVIGLERKDATSAVSVDIDALNYGVDAAALVSFNNWRVGAAAKAKLAKAGGVEVGDYNVLLGWADKSTTLAVQTNAKLSKATAGYYQVVSDKVTTAAVAKFPLAFAPAPAVDVEVGLSYKLAGDATANAKVSSAGRVSASYAQVLSASSKITFAADVDAANISSDDHKFGILLNLTPA